MLEHDWKLTAYIICSFAHMEMGRGIFFLLAIVKTLTVIDMLYNI